MKSTDTLTGVAYENCTAYVLARITGLDGAVITQATLSSVTCKVYKITGTDEEPVYTLTVAPTVTIATSVYDTLQTGAQWDKDSRGYNFRFQIPGTCFPDGDAYYMVEFVFVPAVDTSGASDWALETKVYVKELQGKS